MREGAKGFIFALRKEDGCLILIILFFFKKNPWEPLCLRRSNLGHVGGLLEY